MCKVKIGLHYEPKWFERRYAQGTYSGKNVALDQDAMWLQNGLIGKPVIGYWKTRIAICVCVSAALFFYFTTMGFI
jgi:hypothetical protein